MFHKFLKPAGNTSQPKIKLRHIAQTKVGFTIVGNKFKLLMSNRQTNIEVLSNSLKAYSINTFVGFKFKVKFSAIISENRSLGLKCIKTVLDSI